MKNKTGLIIWAVVLGFLLLSVVKTYSVYHTDIADEKVEEMATSLGLVSMEEAQYPSLAEMEERVQKYQAGEAFTDVGVNFSIFLCIAIVILSVGLTFYKMLNDKEKLIRFAIPVAGLFLLYVINYATADISSFSKGAIANVSPAKLKMVTALVSTTIFLLVVSVAFLVVVNLKKAVGK